MMAKKYCIPANQIREVATGHGACFASDRITVDGEKVGYMFREAAAADGDSGWRFFAGDESTEYTDVPTNFGLYDVNTVANYDPEIVPFLDLPPGAALARDEGGTFVQVDDDVCCEEEGCGCHGEHEHSHEHGPGSVVSGTIHLTNDWSLALPAEFEQHTEDNDLVLWRPGFTTYCAVFGCEGDAELEERIATSVEQRLEEIKAQISPEAYAGRETHRDGMAQYTYRMEEELEEGPVHACYSFICGKSGMLQLAIYFDDEAEFATALELCAGVSHA